MSKKLIFLDIDGTLTPAGSNIPPERAVRAIKKAQEAGHKVFLCTGRNVGMLSPLLAYGFDGYVASAGGYVVCGDEVLFDCPMTNAQRDVALESLHANGVFCTIESRDATWGDENLGDFLENSGSGNSEIERWRKALAKNLGIQPMGAYDGSPIYKVVFMCLKTEQLDEAKKLLEDQFSFCCQEVTAHSCLNGELINRQFDKGRGVLNVCNHLGMDVSETIGFGDSMNDLEMIETVGISVCMVNGAKQLQELADIVCPSVEDEGLAKAFVQLGLINENDYEI